MSDTNQREALEVESLFERAQRREEEINHALKLEAERHPCCNRFISRLSAYPLLRV